MFLDVMNKNQILTYADMVQQLRQAMRTKVCYCMMQLFNNSLYLLQRFTQVPQFSYNLQNFDVRTPIAL